MCYQIGIKDYHLYYLKIMFVKDVFLESNVDCCFHLVQLGEH